MNKIKKFFLERLFVNGYETVFETLFYILGWAAVLVLLGLHFCASHLLGLSFDISELIWILSIPASFSSLGQYIGRAASGVLLSEKTTNERIASLVGVILSAGFVTAAIHFKCVDANFVSSASATTSWEYMVATLPLVTNAIVAGCGYTGRVFDYFTQKRTIIDLLRWTKNKITGQPTTDPLENMPKPPSGIKNYFKNCFKDYESTCRTVGFVLGITLGIVLIATGTALLPFSGGSSIALHVLACALFVFISGRTFSAMGKYAGKATDCLLDNGKDEKGKEKRPLNEQICSLIGMGVGLVLSIALIPLHKLGASFLVSKISDKVESYVTLGIPLMMSTVAAGFAYAGKFVDNLAKRKTFVDGLEWIRDETKIGLAFRKAKAVTQKTFSAGFSWIKNKIFGSESQPQETEEVPASIEKGSLSKIAGVLIANVDANHAAVNRAQEPNNGVQINASSFKPILQPAGNDKKDFNLSDISLAPTSEIYLQPCGVCAPQ